MARQATPPQFFAAGVLEALGDRRQRLQQLFEEAKIEAPARARTRLRHWFRNLVDGNYRERHLLLESRSRALAEIEFRARAVRLYTSLREQADVLQSRLADSRFSGDLREGLARGSDSLSVELVEAVSPGDPYSELSERQRARVADRLEELEGLIEITARQLDERLGEKDITQWLTGEAPTAETITDASGEAEESPTEKVQSQLKETRDRLRETRSELDSLRDWTTFFGALWVIDLLDDD